MWKDIKGFEKLYQISNKGQIKSLTKKRGFYQAKEMILKQKITKFGYANITLLKNNKPSFCVVHRLVAETFIPNPENKPQVNHKDGNKLNNHVSNLEWCTCSENMKHAYKNNLRDSHGENHSQNKLTNKDIINIRKSKEKGCNLSKKYSVSRSSISRIRKGNSWKHLL